MTRIFKLGYIFVKRGRITLLSLNELGEKSRATIILGKFVNNPKSNSHWLIFSENVFDWSEFKDVLMTYYFLDLLIFFWLTLDI